MRQPSPSRRQFLSHSAAMGAALAAPPLFVSSRVLGREGRPGANGAICVGFIGAGIRAGQLMVQLLERPRRPGYELPTV